MNKKFLTVVSSAITTASASTMFAMNAFADDAAASSGSGQGGAGTLVTFILPLGIMFVLLYFMAIKPQKKREQEAKEMQESLQVGDEVVTSGGIVGMVVRIGDDTVVIETGGERHKLRIKKWAIGENVSATERAKAASAKTKTKLAAAGVTDTVDEKKEKKSKKLKKEEPKDEE